MPESNGYPAAHPSKHSLKPHNNPMRKRLVLRSLYQQGNESKGFAQGHRLDVAAPGLKLEQLELTSELVLPSMNALMLFQPDLGITPASCPTIQSGFQITSEYSYERLSIPPPKTLVRNKVCRTSCLQ